MTQRIYPKPITDYQLPITSPHRDDKCLTGHDITQTLTDCLTFALG